MRFIVVRTDLMGDEFACPPQLEGFFCDRETALAHVEKEVGHLIAKCPSLKRAAYGEVEATQVNEFTRRRWDVIDTAA